MPLTPADYVEVPHTSLDFLRPKPHPFSPPWFSLGLPHFTNGLLSSLLLQTRNLHAIPSSSQPNHTCRHPSPLGLPSFYFLPLSPLPCHPLCQVAALKLVVVEQLPDFPNHARHGRSLLGPVLLRIVPESSGSLSSSLSVILGAANNP